MIDPEEEQYALFKDVVDYRYVNHKKKSIYIDDGGNQQPKASTLGWELCENGWMGLLFGSLWPTQRESSPVEVAEYAISRHLDKEPTFC
jgi:hypothetical protein